MRRPAVIALLVPALLLAGCGTTSENTPGEDGAATTETTSPDQSTGGSGEPGTAGSAADIATLRSITVEGEPGAAPTVTFTPELTFEGTAALLISDGDGEELVAGQTASTNYVVFGGDSVEPLESTWDYDDYEAQLALTDATIPEIVEVLVGQHVGARAILAVPGVAGTEEEGGYPATILVLEIMSARDVLERAEGTAVTPPAGLPVVTLAENGEPSIEIPADAVEPEELVVQPLIEGDGPAIEAGQTVTFHYSGWLWDGTPFDSSWSNGSPFVSPVGVGQLIEGWDAGLIGHTVGSQLLLVVPSDQGYGDNGSGTIPGGATLIFVVDVLDIA